MARSVISPSTRTPGRASIPCRALMAPRPVAFPGSRPATTCSSMPPCRPHQSATCSSHAAARFQEYRLPTNCSRRSGDGGPEAGGRRSAAGSAYGTRAVGAAMPSRASSADQKPFCSAEPVSTRSAPAHRRTSCCRAGSTWAATPLAISKCCKPFRSHTCTGPGGNGVLRSDGHIHITTSGRSSCSSVVWSRWSWNSSGRSRAGSSVCSAFTRALLRGTDTDTS